MARSSVLWVLAVGCGGAPPPETVVVTVAARELVRGETIGADDLALVELPAAFASPLGAADLVGRVPRERILPLEPVREERLADPNGGVGLAARVPRGLRALSVDLASPVALVPGDLVDVALAAERQGEAFVTLIAGARVLAVDGRVDGVAVAPRRSVTLAVTPAAAEQVTFAASQGGVTLLER